MVDLPVRRFDRTERVLHWVNAALFLLLVVTGAVMYNGALSGFVGRRLVVRTVHVYSGLSLPFVSAPAQVDRTPPPLAQAPAFNDDADDILAAVGMSPEEIIEAKIAGALA